MAARDRMLRLLTEVCSLATAPFCEQHVMTYVHRFASRRPVIKLRGDRFGNLLLVVRGRRSRNRRRLVLVAHTDHPGFIVTASEGPTVTADFHGGVAPQFVDGAKVLLFDDDAVVPAKVTAVHADQPDRTAGAILRARRAVAVGAFGMFDLGEARILNDRLHSRACDDLAGVASALAAIDQIARTPAQDDLAVLLTRGEEQGFLGALASVIRPSLLRPTDLMLSIECSAEQPVARQGDGVVLRVGDRTSIFHSAFTHFIGTIAAESAKADPTFKFQRALMPGGTCEATVFDAWGYCTAAACVPLGNYHNMNKQSRRLAAEHVHVTDWLNLVRLLVNLARRLHDFDGTHAALRQSLTNRYQKFRALL